MNQEKLYEKYKNSRFTPDGIANYMDDLTRISDSILKSKSERSTQDVAETVKEVNAIHNGVMEQFKADGKQMPLIKDAYLVFAKSLHPEIKRFL